MCSQTKEPEYDGIIFYFFSCTSFSTKIYYHLYLKQAHRADNCKQWQKASVYSYQDETNKARGDFSSMGNMFLPFGTIIFLSADSLAYPSRDLLSIFNAAQIASIFEAKLQFMLSMHKLFDSQKDQAVLIPICL